MTIQRKLHALIAVWALGSCLPARAIAQEMKDVPLTLTGCVVAGEEKDSFLLSNVVVDGSTLAPTDAFYRFNTTKDFKDHVGKRVEVKGKADLDDPDKGKLQVNVENGKATTTVKSERRTVKVEENVRFGSPGSMKMTADVVTYKFDVKSVTPVAGNCESAAVAR